MALSPEIRKLLQQALRIRNSQVPLHRVMDILATDDGDVSTVVYRFRDVKNDDLRRAFHQCAVLLRELEAEAGLKPSWETYQSQNPPQNATGAAGSSSGTATKTTAEPKPPTVPKVKFRADELIPFEDEAARNNVRIAKAYVDGASKGNPGDAGIGIAMFSLEGKKIAQISRAIGLATNNIAEYTALIEALHLAKRMGVRQLFVLGDSQLMVHQMNGVYKIKNVEILQKVKEAKALTKEFEKFTISYIAREHNTLADALSTAQLKKKPKPPADPTAETEDLMGPIDDMADEGMTE
jgi:ribonuclease HI